MIRKNATRWLSDRPRLSAGSFLGGDNEKRPGPQSPNTSAVVDAATGKVLWKKDHFAAGAVESGIVAGYMTDGAWLHPRPLGLAAVDGHQLWQLDESLEDRAEYVGGSLSMQLAAPGVLLAQGMQRAGLGFTMLTQLLDAKSGAKRSGLIDKEAFDSKAKYDDGVIILDHDRSGMAAYDATSLTEDWALPDLVANRISLNRIGAFWHGTLYGGANYQPALLDARTGTDKMGTLACVPKVLVPGYALCGDSYSVQVYPIK